MLYTLYCRTYQGAYRIASKLMPWREPILIQGAHTLKNLGRLLKDKSITTVLIVTDQVIVSLPFMTDMLKQLDKEGILYTVYDQVIPNPTIDNIEAAREAYLAHNCEALVAIGGGSVIDCAKGIAARLARPNKTIPQLKGQLKVRKQVTKLFAIPTTSGTGSEATVAAVISNKQTLEKYAINDLALIPNTAILDPIITLNLPRPITSTTGIDALTHAVEAYIGKSNTQETKQYSIDAVRLIFQNLEEAYNNGHNIIARENMQMAAYKAGLAFTRAYVGNIHAIAHTLGGFYQIPHGLANAVIMPHILKFYGSTIHKPLSELAKAANVGTVSMSQAERAEAFILAIEQLNERMEIPKTLKGIKDEDIPTLVQRALAEANPLYPVPVIMNAQQMTQIYKQIQQD